MTPKKIYLAGPMRGYAQFNFPKFNEVAAKLRAAGHTVFNPAERDVEEYGEELAASNAYGDEELAAKDFGFSLREALHADLTYICLHADTVVLLPGWERSKGALAERATGEALGLVIEEYCE